MVAAAPGHGTSTAHARPCARQELDASMPEPTLKSPWGEGWDGEVATRWLAFETDHDRVNGPFGAVALARAQPTACDRVIDVGCGCGATSRDLAEAVGPCGHVLGIDVSPPLLARARQQSVLPHLEFLEADAQTERLPGDRDLIFSRFGLMFFQDPGAAFSNLAGALRPRGRLTFVCWRRFEENPWLHVPFSVARDVLPAAPVPPATGPSPFAFADPAGLEQLLRAAGFRSVDIERTDQSVVLGRDLTSATAFAMHTGPVGRGLAGADAATRAEVGRRISAALSAHAQPEGIRVPGSAWVVTAVRPPFTT
jgi:SAM-dependent methyltransferase